MFHVFMYIRHNLKDMPKHSGKHTFSPTKNGIKCQIPSLFVLPRKMKKIPPPSFRPSPHLDFEINFLPGSSGTISTLKMSQMLEILILHLVLNVN